jgi:DNA-binding NarL/FixJ family response regulator
MADQHQRDIAFGTLLGVRWLSYHQDFVSVQSPAGAVVQYRTFCIAEAPTADAVQACHVLAHGHQANAVLEVQPSQVEGFLAGKEQLNPELVWREARRGPKFTTRQAEILRLIAAGRTNVEIAAALCLSPHTVARHVANILDRAGLANRAEAAAQAQRLGLV